MGLKSGSRDAGLDDTDGEENEETTSTEPDSQDDEPAARTESDPQNVVPEPSAETSDDVPETDESKPTKTSENAATDQSDSPSATMPDSTSEPTTVTTRETTTEPQIEHDTASPSRTAESDERPAMSSIPYKMRREKVNEGRDQVPFFLRKEVIDAEDDLQDALEAQLGEDVYKSDYREAAMVVAQRNPELVAEVLREWGYDLEL